MNPMDLTDREFEISETAYRRGFRQATDTIMESLSRDVSVLALNHWQIKVWSWYDSPTDLFTVPPQLPQLRNQKPMSGLRRVGQHE